MKLKKLNRGAIFSFFVIVCVIVNIIVVSAQRKEWKNEITDLTNEYFSVVREALLLPEEYRSNGKMSDDEYSSYLDKITQKLKPLCVDNEVLLDSIVSSIDKCLKAQMLSNIRLTDLKVELLCNDFGEPTMYGASFVKDSAKTELLAKISSSLTKGAGYNSDYFFVASYQRINDEWKITGIEINWQDIIRNSSSGQTESLTYVVMGG